MPTPDYKYDQAEEDVIDMSDFYITDAIAKAYQAALLNGSADLKDLARKVHQHPRKAEMLSLALAGFLAATDDVGVIYYFTGIYSNMGYYDADA